MIIKTYLEIMNCPEYRQMGYNPGRLFEEKMGGLGWTTRNGQEIMNI